MVGLIGLIWIVEIFNLSLGHRLGAYGIIPRDPDGLRGIIFAPFLHGSLQHAIANTVPLAVLGFFVVMRGTKDLLFSSLMIVVVGGGGVWLIGRPAYHIGASILVFGYFGFLVARGWYERSFGAIIISAIVLLLYGGMIWGMLPSIPHVSWEGHLCGCIGGVLGARLIARKKI
ncbi:MAG: rhomboid family intramembrane serine protease [Chitinivibrionales bacterium]|nr:rhomboid family intramembrane serine protease [Chitinivibrionales bacterium]